MSKAQPRKRLTLSLPEEDWDNLEAEALAKGLTIGTYGSMVVRDHVNPSLKLLAPPAPSADEWSHFITWMNLHGLTAQRIKDETGIKSRRMAIEWAKTRGYVPGAIARAGNETAY